MKHILLIVSLLTIPLFAQDQEIVPEPTQRTDAPFRLFRTQNIYTLLKLDTRTGEIWQVQWGKYSIIVPINRAKLADGRRAGRFTLYATQNIYAFILLDQEDGRQWFVQWSADADKRFIEQIMEASPNVP
jgi:hypothetical protein